MTCFRITLHYILKTTCIFIHYLLETAPIIYSFLRSPVVVFVCLLWHPPAPVFDPRMRTAGLLRQNQQEQERRGLLVVVVVATVMEVAMKVVVAVVAVEMHAPTSTPEGNEVKVKFVLLNKSSL